MLKYINFWTSGLLTGLILWGATATLIAGDVVIASIGGMFLLLFVAVVLYASWQMNKLEREESYLSMAVGAIITKPMDAKNTERMVVLWEEEAADIAYRRFPWSKP